MPRGTGETVQLSNRRKQAVTKEMTVVDEFRGTLHKMADQFKAALPEHVPVERFERTVMTAVSLKPDLLNLDRRSLLASCTQAASDGLLLDGREAALVPFKGQVQYMPMVAGIMKKVRNSGDISTWSVHLVHEHDKFDYVLGDDERIDHKPALRDRGAIVGAYSIVRMKDGERSREFMSVDEIDAIRRRSRSADSGPWKSDYGEMCKKTVVRRHAKRLPQSTDLDALLRRDEAMTGLAEPIESTATVVQMPQKRASRLQAAAGVATADSMPEAEDGPQTHAERVVDGNVDPETGEIF
jgi:recombination protein RecT